MLGRGLLELARLFCFVLNKHLTARLWKKRSIGGIPVRASAVLIGRDKQFLKIDIRILFWKSCSDLIFFCAHIGAPYKYWGCMTDQ